MPEKITDLVSVWDGLPQGEVLYLLTGSDLLTEERASHTMLFELSGKRRSVVTLDWTARDIAADPDHETGILAMGIKGQMARFRDGQVESLPPISPSPRGTLLYLGLAGNQLMACGGNQQVYRYSSGGHWTPHEKGLTRPQDGGLSQFEFIVGDDQSDTLYTGGARGEAWHWHGQQWQRLDMPTNVRLLSACRGPDGKWWIAGQLGTLIHGSGTAWDVVHYDEEISYFWDIVFFQDELFVTTDRILFRWNDGKLEPINFADDMVYEGTIPFSFSKLAVSEDRLYSFGAKDVLCFEGDHWHRII